MKSAMQMMLEGAGIDLNKIMADFEALKNGVTVTLQSIDQRIALLQQRQNLLLERIELWMRLNEAQEQQKTPQRVPLQVVQLPMPPGAQQNQQQ